jgi:peptidyl-dipeptidase A
MKKSLLFLFASALLASCGDPAQKQRDEVQSYLDAYNNRYKELYTVSAEGQWAVQTHIVEGDTLNAYNSRMADEAMARFTGSKDNIEKATAYLKWKDQLSPLQVKELEKILFLAAGNPETDSVTVKERIKAETAQTEKLYGFKFSMDGKEVTPNDIVRILNESKDLAERQKAWEASKAVGKDLKEGLVNLRNLRNKVVQALGYNDYFSYMVSEYGMTNEEMMQLLQKFNKELFPLYRELHTYARYELARKYGVKEVPDYIPAHWLTNRWGQDWNEMISVQGMNLDSALHTKDAEWFPHQAERFYMSIGFDSLPQVFWDRSSLYPVAKDAGYKKNTHASAWHMDLDKDVRSLMSIEPNAEWYETTHHEFGHIYYYMTYSIPENPYLMREGANRAYHEALGSLMGLAAMQKPFAAGVGLVDGSTPTDTLRQLLKDAMNYVVFIPWSAGTMSQFEHDLYTDNLSPDQFNRRWLDIVKKYQGIVPPTERGEEYCDAASKTHINDDPAGYYDYALSYVLLFQLHDYISKKILHQDPHFTNYYGNKEVGKFIQDIMRPGGTGDWRQLLKDKTGEDLSARAMLDYFSPLLTWLKKENEGRKYTLPEVM